MTLSEKSEEEFSTFLPIILYVSSHMIESRNLSSGYIRTSFWCCRVVLCRAVQWKRHAGHCVPDFLAGEHAGKAEVAAGENACQAEIAAEVHGTGT